MRRLLLLLMTVLVVAGCGNPGARPAGPAGPAEDSAPASLSADGSVPWANLKITDRDLNGPPYTPRSPAAGSKPCRAEQLSGRLTNWAHPGNAGETPHGMDAAIGKLIGEVDVQNSSKVECTLQGEVPTTMIAGGREVPMFYTHTISEEGRARVVAVPAGGHANLRLDWSGPFCQPIDGPLELAIDLPHGGGTLRAPITVSDHPVCTSGEGVNPNARATLYASGFSEQIEESAPPRSPLDQLVVTVAGPATAASGSRLTFRVTRRATG